MVPVALEYFLQMFIVSALVILSGTGYALSYAFRKKLGCAWLRLPEYLCFGLLTFAVSRLGQIASFDESWHWLSVMMLIAYFWAPIGIWHLTAKTHPSSDEDNA